MRLSIQNKKKTIVVTERRAREAGPVGGIESTGRAPAHPHLPRHRARHPGRHRRLLHAHTRLPGNARAQRSRRGRVCVCGVRV